jgi:ATP adenylyltransferase
MTVEAASPGSADAYPGVPDGFQRLWTPHRQVYIDSHHAPGPSVCPFCAAPGLEPGESLIVRRGQLAYAVLNLYPYNSGHLLVCPYRHVADYTDLTGAETAEVAELTRQAMRVLRAAYDPAGFNLGMNQGAVAGAGVAGHLHQHVVPRWAGDSNFFPIIAETRALPQVLGDTRERVAATWADVVGD